MDVTFINIIYKTVRNFFQDNKYLIKILFLWNSEGRATKKYPKHVLETKSDIRSTKKLFRNKKVVPIKEFLRVAMKSGGEKMKSPVFHSSNPPNHDLTGFSPETPENRRKSPKIADFAGLTPKTPENRRFDRTPRKCPKSPSKSTRVGNRVLEISPYKVALATLPKSAIFAGFCPPNVALIWTPKIADFGHVDGSGPANGVFDPQKPPKSRFDRFFTQITLFSLLGGFPTTISSPRDEMCHFSFFFDRHSIKSQEIILL